MSYISMLVKVLAIVIIIASNAAFAQQPVARATTANTASQRFVLFQGTFVASVGGSNTNDQKALFKIDTATGDVWMFVTGISDGKLIQRWSKIEN